MEMFLEYKISVHAYMCRNLFLIYLVVCDIVLYIFAFIKKYLLLCK